MPNEGTNTILDHLSRIGWQSNLPFIISSGDYESHIPFYNIDKFKHITRRISNSQQANLVFDQIYSKKHKPFQFLFLNGVYRHHRQRLIDSLHSKQLLDKALWSALYMNKFLPMDYDAKVNIHTVENGKYTGNDWPDGIITSLFYIDTYFSLVTETNFDYPTSFRTEKIYKPLIVGHPFIAVANRGFYKDLKNVGFKTFSTLIDESFDLIDNATDRLDRILQIVIQLCQTDLVAFLEACRPICEYNKQLMYSIDTQYSTRELQKKLQTRILEYAQTK